MSNRLVNLAWKVEGLNGSQKLLLIRLSDRAGEDGLCWPGQTSLAKECCLTNRTVGTALAELVIKGHLVVQCRATFDTPTTYRVTPQIPEAPAKVNGGAKPAPPAKNDPPENPSGVEGNAGGAEKVLQEGQSAQDPQDLQEMQKTTLPPEKFAGGDPKNLRTNPKGTQRNQDTHTAGAQEAAGVRVKIVQAGTVVAPQPSGPVTGSTAMPPPTLPAATEFGARCGILPQVVEKWFWLCDSRQWLDPQTKLPIGNWQSALKAFAIGWREREGRQSAASGTAAQARRAVGPSRDPLDPANLKI